MNHRTEVEDLIVITVKILCLRKEGKTFTLEAMARIQRHNQLRAMKRASQTLEIRPLFKQSDLDGALFPRKVEDVCKKNFF